jgi:hypothetical protein
MISRLPRLTGHVRTRRRQLGCITLFAFAILPLDQFRLKRSAGVRLRRSHLHGKVIVITIPVTAGNHFSMDMP